MMRLTTLLIILSVPIFGYGQYEATYTPLRSYSKYSSDKSFTELVSALRAQTASEIKSLKSKKLSTLEKTYKSRMTILINLVEREKIIRDDSLEGFVQNALNKIVVSNSIRHKPGKVLIMREPSVNAICYGEGTIIVTVGLISRIVNEAQLAFALAHEVAHYELDHVRKKIVESLEREMSAEIKAEIDSLEKGEITQAGLERIKSWMYSIGQYSRAKELQADSLGLVYFKKAGYPEREAISLLAILDSSDGPKYKLDGKLFQPLDFTKYPFQNSWLKNRLSVYSNKRFNNFIIPIDSLKSHPEFQIRKSALHVSGYDSTIQFKNARVMTFASIADFEMVESAYTSFDYDQCLYYALQLKSLYPKNVYLNRMIGRILTTLSETKFNALPMYLYVNPFIDHYPDELRKVNCFLYNTMAGELGEIAFNYLNQKDNFNPEDEETYYLLWKTCSLTQRTSVKAKVKEMYMTKFPKGVHLKKMRK